MSSSHLEHRLIFSHRDVFLRELISNANDAIEKLRLKSLTNKNFWDGSSPLNITVKTIKDDDGKTGRVIITDTGIGMTPEELSVNLVSANRFLSPKMPLTFLCCRGERRVHSRSLVLRNSSNARSRTFRRGTQETSLERSGLVSTRHFWSPIAFTSLPYPLQLSKRPTRSSTFSVRTPMIPSLSYILTQEETL